MAVDFPATRSPSEMIYPDQTPNRFDEVNRTLMGVLALLWIHQDDYKSFSGGNSPENLRSKKEIRLNKESFKWIRQLYSELIYGSDQPHDKPKDPEELYALITSIVTNDLGKDRNLARDYAKKTGIDIEKINHDAILYEASKAGMIEAINRLQPKYKQDIFLGLELGATFNPGQLAQAENAPVSLKGLHRMRGQERSFRLRFVEQLLDVGGAAGHMDWTSAKKLIQPIFDAYKNAYNAYDIVVSAKGQSEDELRATERRAYNSVLSGRAKLLKEKGYRMLDVTDTDERALLRVLCMGGVANAAAAENFEEVWKSLKKKLRDTLVKALDVDGDASTPAVQPTYMPNILNNVRTAIAAIKREDLKKENPLTVALEYLARVMTEDLKIPEGTEVFERDLKDAATDYAKSYDKETKKYDIEILKKAKVPVGVVSQPLPEKNPACAE